MLSGQHMNHAYLSESELLHRFRQAIAEVNERTGSQYKFVHGTDDGFTEPKSEEWNEERPDERAVGECAGQSAAGLPHRFTVFLHQDEFGPKFQLVDRFAETFVYPTEAASIYTVDCDILPDVRPILTPDIKDTERAVILAGVAASGSLEVAALARHAEVEDSCDPSI